MTWSKQNLVTLPGGYDVYKCDVCGYKAKYGGLNRPRGCPKCAKNVVDDKPFGWWSPLTVKHVCIKCGGEAAIVPKEGHPLSDYWNLQQIATEGLFYCVAGCTEQTTVRKIEERRLKKTLNILFVSGDNAFRSYAAEVIAKQLKKKGKHPYYRYMNIASAGISDLAYKHKTISDEVIKALKEFGYSNDGARTKQVDKAWMKWSDIVYYMDNTQLDPLRLLRRQTGRKVLPSIVPLGGFDRDDRPIPIVKCLMGSKVSIMKTIRLIEKKILQHL